jgi:hypothetical protein
VTPERWPLIKRILEGAWERVEEDRSAYLEDACSGDPILRKSVEALLASDKTPDGFLEQLPPVLAEIR